MAEKPRIEFVLVEDPEATEYAGSPNRGLGTCDQVAPEHSRTFCTRRAHHTGLHVARRIDETIITSWL